MKTKLLICLLIAVAAAVAPRANAQIIVYDGFLTGPAESPPNASPGTGFAEVTLNLTLHTLRVQMSFSGLTGVTTASHIHAATAMPGTGTAIVATQLPSFTGFPLGVTSGSMDQTLDLTMASSYNPAFISANGGTPATAETALAAALAADEAYINIHTSTFGGGEIRAFLLPVPEPATLALLVAAGVLIAVRKLRS